MCLGVLTRVYVFCLDNLQTMENLFLVTFYGHVSRWFLLASPRHLPVSLPQNAEVTGVVSHIWFIYLLWWWLFLNVGTRDWDSGSHTCAAVALTHWTIFIAQESLLYSLFLRLIYGGTLPFPSCRLLYVVPLDKLSAIRLFFMSADILFCSSF